MAEEQEKRIPEEPVGPTEGLPVITEKLSQVVKLLTEAGSYDKLAPKYKRMLEDAKMVVAEVSLLMQQAAGEDAGVHRLLAPMPGVILRCERKVGEEVRQGDVVLILDAMKMENPIAAPATGKIISLPCAEGQKVAKGAVIAVIASAASHKHSGKIRQFR